MKTTKTLAQRITSYQSFEKARVERGICRGCFDKSLKFIMELIKEEDSQSD